jgi:hypothetical protein
MIIFPFYVATVRRFDSKQKHFWTDGDFSMQPVRQKRSGGATLTHNTNLPIRYEPQANCRRSNPIGFGTLTEPEYPSEYAVKSTGENDRT